MVNRLIVTDKTGLTGEVAQLVVSSQLRMAESPEGSGDFQLDLNPLTFQSAIITPDSTTGLITWTYANAFAPGVIPRVFAQVVGPAANNYNVWTTADPTNTQASFKVARQNPTLISLLGGPAKPNTYQSSRFDFGRHSR